MSDTTPNTNYVDSMTPEERAEQQKAQDTVVMTTTSTPKNCTCTTKYCEHYESDFDRYVKENPKESCSHGIKENNMNKSVHNPCPYGNDDCPKCSKRVSDTTSKMKKKIKLPWEVYVKAAYEDIKRMYPGIKEETVMFMKTYSHDSPGQVYDVPEYVEFEIE